MLNTEQLNLELCENRKNIFLSNIDQKNYFYTVSTSPSPPPHAHTQNQISNRTYFSRNYTDVRKYIIDSWCFVSVSGSAIYWKYRCWAKLIKLIRIILFSSLFLYILSPPTAYFDPPFINFSKFLKHPRLFWPSPPFIMSLRLNFICSEFIYILFILTT